MFVVDTNILIYAANRDAPENARCGRLIESWRAQQKAWYVTWGIAYEFLRVTTHPRVLQRPFTLGQSWQFLEALFASSNLQVLAETDRHRQVVAEILAEVPDISGNLVFDAHTAILMRENGVKTIYTHDLDFRRFPFLDVLDPISEEGATRPAKQSRSRRD
ncbi:MAG: TA system VapC family ribonuclease toxin [Candidatus Brocadiia bacterium]